MQIKPYSYLNRKGVRPISWEDFHGICKGLAIAISGFDPEIILGIARGGLYPATLLSHILQKELYPVRLTRRFEDIVTRDVPTWLIKPPESVAGKKVLVVDEICDSGETINMVKQEVVRLGSSEVKGAVMYSHTRGKGCPDFIGIISDELILNPWDREIYKDGKFVVHPEYAGAISQQGIKTDFSVVLDIKALGIAKG